MVDELNVFARCPISQMRFEMSTAFEAVLVSCCSGTAWCFCLNEGLFAIFNIRIIMKITPAAVIMTNQIEMVATVFGKLGVAESGFSSDLTIFAITI